jgi:acyl carrier protein
MSDDEQKISAAICQLANIPALAADQDIYNAGMSSIQALQLLVELETQFEVTLPDEAFVAARTVQALKLLVHNQRSA